MAIFEHLDDSGPDDDSFGLLDMLAVVIEGLRSLLLVPFCAGVFAYGLVSFLTTSADFRSSASLSLSDATADVALSTANLAAIASQPLVTVPTSAIRVEKTSVPRVFMISVTMPEREQAATALNRIVENLTAPDFVDHGLKRFEENIEAKRRRLESLKKITENLTVESDRAKAEKPSEEVVSIAHTIEELTRSVFEIEVSLNADGQKLSAWKKPKLVEQFPVASLSGLPGKRIIVTFVVLTSGLAVLIVLFVRDLFRRAETDHRNAAKVARIRKALRGRS